MVLRGLVWCCEACVVSRCLVRYGGGWYWAAGLYLMLWGLAICCEAWNVAMQRGFPVWCYGAWGPRRLLLRRGLDARI